VTADAGAKIFQKSTTPIESAAAWSAAQ